MKKIKAVIFDMDGVLIDAVGWHYEALNKSLSLFGYNISESEHKYSFDGLPTSVKLEKLSRERNLPEKLHSFINEMKQAYTIEYIYKYCRPIFAHEYALTKLKHNGYKIGLASNSIKKTIEIMMRKANLMSFFDVTLSNQDVEKAKPDPEIYIKTMSLMNLSPCECLILEDNENGIKAAVDSGGHVLKISSIWNVNYLNIANKISQIEN
tara:strand:- start:6301 stop:6927 length:627 start_codon:yes stop_codon:yes gene_type:complete